MLWRGNCVQHSIIQVQYVTEIQIQVTVSYMGMDAVHVLLKQLVHLCIFKYIECLLLPHAVHFLLCPQLPTPTLL